MRAWFLVVLLAACSGSSPTEGDTDGGADAGARCGNQRCEASETACTCAEDCPRICGDGCCSGIETACSCPGDCPADCGDGCCTGEETACSCSDDCARVCGDGCCTGSETACSCSDDCANECGDGCCQGTETCLGCPEDCTGSCCGNSRCEAGEGFANCPGDCRETCGDGTCEPSESPYVLFMIDTSASMAWDSCDPSGGTGVDETRDCPGTDVACATCDAPGCDNGRADDSRLWKVKTATTDAVQRNSQTTFALARFHMDPVDFVCEQGGWEGPDALSCMLSPLGEGDNAADILVKFDDADPRRNVREWLDLQTNYIGFPPPPTSCLLCDDCGGGCDKELRTHGATPLAGSLFSIDTYLDTARASDSLATCRPYAVILLTDGTNTCPDPNNPSDPDPTPEQAAALCAAGTPVYVIGFAATSIAEILNEVAAAGCGSACNATGCDGVARLVNDEDELSQVLGDIIGAQNINACGDSPAICPDDCCNGNGRCDAGETACCAGEGCAAACGDGCCTATEDAEGCPADCS